MPAKKVTRKRTAKKVVAKKATKKAAPKNTTQVEDEVAKAKEPKASAPAAEKPKEDPAPKAEETKAAAPAAEKPKEDPAPKELKRATNKKGIMTPRLRRCIDLNLATYYGVGKVPKKVSDAAAEAIDAGFSVLVVRSGSGYDIKIVEDKFDYNDVSKDPVVAGSLVNLARRAFEVGAYPRKG